MLSTRKFAKLCPGPSAYAEICEVILAFVKSPQVLFQTTAPGQPAQR